MFTEQERYEQWRHAHGFDKQAMPTYYHITDNPDFKPDPNHAPENNGTMGGNFDPGLFVSKDPSHWMQGYGYWRPYVSELDVPDDVGDNFQNSPERFIKPEDYDKLQVKRTIPIDAYAREQYGEYGWTEEDSGKDLHTGEPLSPSNSVGRLPDYTFENPRPYKFPGTAMDHPEDWRKNYEKQVNDYQKKTPGIMASKWFTGSWDDYDDDQRAAEEDAMWDDYTPNAEEMSWLKDDDNDIPQDEDVEAQARQDAIGSGFGSAEDDAHDELAHQRNTDWATYENLTPPKDHGRNGARPPMTMEPISQSGLNGVMARHTADGRPIGHLMWDPDGEIASVNAHPDFEGRGIANAMLHHARSNPEVYDSINPIHHSDMLSPHGEAWARSDPHHTMKRNFTSINTNYGSQGSDKYGTYLGQGIKYRPTAVPYVGQDEQHLQATKLVKKGPNVYGQQKPPPRQYVQPGQGHLGEHMGPAATNMNWGK